MGLVEIFGAIGGVIGVLSPILSWLWLRNEMKKAEKLKNNILEADAVEKILGLQTKEISEEFELSKKIKEIVNFRTQLFIDEIENYKKEREAEKIERERERAERIKEKEETDKFRIKISEDMDFLIKCYKSVLKSTCSVTNCLLRRPTCGQESMSENEKERLKSIL